MFDLQVERLFREAPDRFQKMRRNPVTGSCWVSGLDPIEPQKRAASRALRARAWFASENPGMPQLPLSYAERENLKCGALPHIVAWLARSLEALDYDCGAHPSFEEYARGVLASPLMPYFIMQDQELLKRYPPRPLPGLGSGLCWRPTNSCS